VDFAGRAVKLLGSDAGFADGDRIVRRWELKFLWFNPLWAVLTVIFAGLVLAGSRRVLMAFAGAAGFGALAVVAFVLRTFDYQRDDAAVQRISTGANVALWGGLALAAALIARHSVDRVEEEPTGPD